MAVSLCIESDRELLWRLDGRRFRRISGALGFISCRISPSGNVQKWRLRRLGRTGSVTRQLVLQKSFHSGLSSSSFANRRCSLRCPASFSLKFEVRVLGDFRDQHENSDVAMWTALPRLNFKLLFAGFLGVNTCLRRC